MECLYCSCPWLYLLCEVCHLSVLSLWIYYMDGSSLFESVKCFCIDIVLLWLCLLMLFLWPFSFYICKEFEIFISGFANWGFRSANVFFHFTAELSSHMLLLCEIRDNTWKYKRKKQDNRFTWFTNKLATPTGKRGSSFIMERQKQNYRIGFAIASIYSAKLRPRPPSFLL